MYKFSNRWGLAFSLLFFILLLVACNNDSTPNTSNSEKTDNTVDQKDDSKKDSGPVTLKFNYGWEEEFLEDIKGPVEDKFPNITLEFVELSLDDVEEEIVKDNIPDIFYLSGADQMPILEEYDLAYDLSELIEKSDLDLNTISEANIDVVRKWSDGGLNFLPYVRRWEALYYNKDVFDRFGIGYPEDGMTWTEVADLARKVNGEIGGSEYRGIDISSSGGMLQQLEVNHVDPQTNESLYATDKRFTKYLKMMEKIASIQGVVPENEDEDWGAFISDQNVAMVPLFDIHLWLKDVEKDTGMPWDMVSYPVWEDDPTKGSTANAGGLSISKTSEHKEESYQVLKYLMSKEWQLMRSKKGYATILNDPEVQQAFSSEVEGLQDKNMQAVFYLDVNSGPEKTSEYEQNGDVLDAMEFIRGDKDINTFLREKSEQANIEIDNAKGSN